MDIKRLSSIINDENRVVYEDIPPEFLSDTLGRLKGTASALVFPLCTQEVSSVLKFAHENRIPVTPRGAGTNLVGSTVPVNGGIILDVSKMNRILELDTETMTATVEPGVLLQDFQKYVEERGLFYPPDPGEKASSHPVNHSKNGSMRTGNDPCLVIIYHNFTETTKTFRKNDVSSPCTGDEGGQRRHAVSCQNERKHPVCIPCPVSKVIVQHIADHAFLVL